ncbi:MAG: tRNA 2-thiouridine(34) synthase MnmA [Candidatus Saccharimonadales bacterium]
MSKKVFVGLSGGVDSSVAAALLVRQGYDVTGVYMKNWSQDIPGFECPWKQDFADAKRIAVHLNIPFKTYDFETEYRQTVVDYMIEGYKAGRTPNPDIMCNQEIKFKLFLKTALADGADYVATGHYARVWHESDADSIVEASGPRLRLFSGAASSASWQKKNRPYQSMHSDTSPLRSSTSSRSPSSDAPQPGARLLKAIDGNKDQTYFLYRVDEAALRKTLFPLGGFTKPEVRKLAEEFGLATANKKESMGICFIGKVGIKEFLLHELGEQPEGDIIDQNGRVLGRHDGAIFYTIGQRHGLGVGAGLPYYVVGKDMAKNEVYVTTNLQDERLWSNTLNLTDVHWISSQPADGLAVQVRTRHRAPLVAGTLAAVASLGAKNSQTTLQLALSDDIRALTPGQSAVLYQDEIVLGGGIIV